MCGRLVLILLASFVFGIVIAEKNHTIAVDVGASVNLPCLVQAKDVPIVTVRWGRKDDSFIAQKFHSGSEKYVEDNKYLIDDALTMLTIFNVTPSDEGVYKCAVELNTTKDSIEQHITSLTVLKNAGDAHSEASDGSLGELYGIPIYIIIIVLVAVVIIVCMVCCVCCYCARKKKKSQKTTAREEYRIV
ncbi:uncharacterized protein LOC144440358 [Glandiceps talaboti]